MVIKRSRRRQRAGLYPNAARASLSVASSAAALRALSPKKVKAVRFNWFLIGTLFGVGSSFFMNFMLSAVIVPQYHAMLSAKRPQARLAEIREDTHSSATLLASVLAPAPARVEKPAPPPISYPREVAVKVSPGDTLIDVLLKQDVASQEAHNVVAALKKTFNPSRLRAGQQLSLTLDRNGDSAPTEVKELAIKLPNLSTVELARLSDGSFSVATAKEPTTKELRRAVGKVRSSLYQAAYDAGIPSGTMGELVAAFSYDVDFQRDIHPGDTIEVLTDREVTADGRVASTGKASYAALTLHGKKHEIFRFVSGGREGWFDAKGNSVKKSLLRTPINAARMSSGFGMRRHPVLGYSRMHRGVDFAAPTGTPILAAGDGVVKFAGWSRGYGNLVKIQHNATYTSAYGHASRIASGVRNGAFVKQGQVIAYVGSTGMSTGPHLHYEILQNGTQVNPAQQRFNTTVALAGADLRRFQGMMGQTRAQIAKLAPNTSQALGGPKPLPPAAKPAPGAKPAPQHLAMR